MSNIKSLILFILVLVFISCTGSKNDKTKTRKVVELSQDILKVQNVLIFRNVNKKGFDVFFDGYKQYNPEEITSKSVISCDSLGFKLDFEKNVQNVASRKYIKYANDKLLKCLDMDFSKSSFSGSITKFMSY